MGKCYADFHLAYLSRLIFKGEIMGGMRHMWDVSYATAPFYIVGLIAR